MDLEKYYEIAKKHCIPDTLSEGFFTTSCQIKNPFTRFEIEFNFKDKTIILKEEKSKIVINLEPPFYTYYEYSINGKEMRITKREIEKDFELENFEKTLKSILHLPRYIRYKMKKYLEKI